ncbi:glycosyltransferase family 2 protein [Halieaceae bacterium IMCC14734]|uniref:Glycosyltransferase family 2 protein n=1 Tax=Candidatus Litorirhabdus singularis TaxID=2518993 RepID=A0ABT3TJ75_9GAMM|nr:glycosyltransferase family 2 protein [Candidatus Litorirhabdus singularis]MCX2982375.1 glycosyltransferase family 2 protein [Candidatus Litorirhabdus singularis]
MSSLSIVIPAKNEADGLRKVLPDLVARHPEAEIIVVNDGSTDSTSEVCREFQVTEVVHPYSKGNGAAIKSGARAASGELMVFMDGDGQHDPADIERLLAKVDEGFDLVVGARSGVGSQASVARWSANTLYNKLASSMVGHHIADLTSGFRAVRRHLFMEFLYLLPNGFSYPTTSTMAFFRAGYSVAFVPIEVANRIGTSHINLLRDGVRFFLIIFKIGTLYSPLKIFFPLSIVLGLLGSFNYLYTYLVDARFTNMSAMMFLAAIIVFLIGLVSEQITNLMYKDV